MNSVRKLEEIFSHFPGIGPRQAKRFVYYLQTRSPSAVKELAGLLIELKNSTRECRQCRRYYHQAEKSVETDMCSICSNKNRDTSLLMIVARDSDLDSIEKGGFYSGYYFVLGGTLPILEPEPKKKIRYDLLVRHIRAMKPKEIILSMNTTPEGENTVTYLRNELAKDVANISISVLGRGLSTGAELEYADTETIKNALKNRA